MSSDSNFKVDINMYLTQLSLLKRMNLLQMF